LQFFSGGDALPMRLVMMGTGPFAVPTFRGLFDTHHAIVALVTQPSKGRPNDPGLSNPMRAVALERGVPILIPADVNAPDVHAQLAALDVDLFVVCDYGQILSPETLTLAQLGGINLHGSLLPKYRGAAPIQWALYHGETETGVSVIHMTPQVDAGPVIAQGSIPIDPEENAAELEHRLAELGPWFIRRAIDALETGILEALPQDPALACKAPRLKKSDGLIDWSRPAPAIKNHVRAMEPWPKSYTFWHRGSGPPLRLVLGRVAVRDCTTGMHAPGQVVEATANRLVIATSEGWISLLQVQPAGKRLLAAEEFLRGYPIRLGDRFGPES
jgi:methionyl-tRNA formyltransferase